MLAWISLAIALALVPGCSFDFEIDDGDETPGEEGRSAWSLSDGLCPGFGYCSFDVPLAVGATAGVRIEVPGRVVDRLTVTVDGPATIGNVSAVNANELITLDVTATGEGEVVLHLIDVRGEELDRARFRTLEPSRIECGILPDGQGPTIGGGAIIDEHEATLFVPRTAADDDDQIQLACVVIDASGEALLSVRLVRWNVREGREAITISSEPFEIGPAGSTSGARVYIAAVTAGTAQVEAQLGDSIESFTITVE